MHLECVCVFSVDQVCVVGIARADLDQLDDAIPPFIILALNRLKGSSTFKVSERAFWLSSVWGSKVDSYSSSLFSPQEWFHSVLWFATPDSGYQQSLSDTKLSALSSNGACPTSFQMSCPPHETILMGFFTGFLHQLWLTEIM